MEQEKLTEAVNDEPEQPGRADDGSEKPQEIPDEPTPPTAEDPASADELHPRRRRRPAAETDTEPGDGASPENETAHETETFHPAVPEEYYPLDRCCICSHPLDTGCAILFTDDHGMARIDEICCNTLEAAARSTDKAEVARAFDYIAAWMPYVKKPVADYLRNYLRVVQVFLNE